MNLNACQTLEGHNRSVLKLAFLNNGSQLISSGSDGLLKLWSLAGSGECVATYDEHDDKVWALCCSKDEQRFVTAGADGKLCIWQNVSDEMRAEQSQATLLK